MIIYILLELEELICKNEIKKRKPQMFWPSYNLCIWDHQILLVKVVYVSILFVLASTWIMVLKIGNIVAAKRNWKRICKYLEFCSRLDGIIWSYRQDSIHHVFIF